MTTNNPNPPRAPMFVSCEPGDVPLPAPTHEAMRIKLHDLAAPSDWRDMFDRYIAAAEAKDARIAELEREVAGLRERANNPCRCEFGEYGWIKSECPVHG